MARFENKICPVCKAPFNRDAEVVVCPICGTPHHKVCYMLKNQCALEELHEQGYVWNGRLPDEPEPIAGNVENTENTDEHHAEYPQDTPIVDENTLFDEMGMENPMRDFLSGIADKTIGADDVSMHELSAYSATSIYHYGRAFRAFRGMNDGKKHKIFFNVCSGLFAPAFQFYRRMDIFGVIVLLITALPSVMLVLSVLGSETGMVSSGAYYLFNLLNTAIMILLCMFGDYIYYKHAVKRIHKIRAEYNGDPTSDEYYMKLYDSGKPSFARAALGLLAAAFMKACVIALPNILGIGA